MLTSTLSYFKQRDDLKQLFTNFFALYLNNAVNYIVPLIIVPYILRTVGVNYYGYFVFAFAFASYFKIIVDFGFDITVTKQIIEHQHNREMLSELFSLLLFSRVILFTVSAVVFSVLLYFIPLARQIGWEFFAVTFLYVFSAVISVTTFFYAFQEIKFTTLTNGIGKICYLICLLVFVKSKGDLIYVALFSSLSWIIPSVILFIMGIKRYKLKIKRPHFIKHKFILYEAKNAFLSDMAVSLYSVTNVFVLGLTTTPFIVGVYGSIEKVFNALTMLLSSSNYALYPRIIKAYAAGKQFFIKKIQQVELAYLLLAIIMGISMFFLSHTICKYLFGQEVKYANVYMLIFSMAIIFSPFGSFYTRCLLILKKSGLLIRITSIGFLINFASLIIIVIVFKSYSAIPLCVLITQIYISLVKRNRVYAASRH